MTLAVHSFQGHKSIYGQRFFLDSFLGSQRLGLYVLWDPRDCNHKRSVIHPLETQSMITPGSLESGWINSIIGLHLDSQFYLWFQDYLLSFIRNISHSWKSSTVRWFLISFPWGLRICNNTYFISDLAAHRIDSKRIDQPGLYGLTISSFLLGEDGLGLPVVSLTPQPMDLTKKREIVRFQGW